MSLIPDIQRTKAQGLRFIIVGLVSNGILYVLYLLLTHLGMDYKMAMTLLFATGVLQTYFFNQRWTFEISKFSWSAMFRYGLLYGSAYLINLAAFWVLIDKAGFPHQFVQAVMILSISVYLFIVQKIWVFSPRFAQTYFFY